MKKTFYISLIGLILILNWDCKRKSEGINSGMKNPIIIDKNLDSVKTKLTKYEKKWIEYSSENGEIKEKLEFYISEFGDSTHYQKKIYNNGVLDTVQSYFWELNAKRTKDGIIKGKLTLYSHLDYSEGHLLKEKTLTLSFKNYLPNKIKAITFESKNQNYVDFEFKNRNDTLVGWLHVYRQMDIINQPDSLMLSTTNYPIDNKLQTDNAFIYVHKLDKNKR